MLQQRLRSPGADTRVGCIFPIAIAAALMLLLVGVVIRTRLQIDQPPREAVVRVTNGATVVSTQIVPLR